MFILQIVTALFALVTWFMVSETSLASMRENRPDIKMAAEKVKTAEAAVVAETASKENQRIAEARAKLMTTDRILAGEMITVSQGVTEKLFISLHIYDYGEDNLEGKGLYARIFLSNQKSPSKVEIKRSDLVFDANSMTVSLERDDFSASTGFNAQPDRIDDRPEVIKLTSTDGAWVFDAASHGTQHKGKLTPQKVSDLNPYLGAWSGKYTYGMTSFNLTLVDLDIVGVGIEASNGSGECPIAIRGRILTSGKVSFISSPANSGCYQIYYTGRIKNGLLELLATDGRDNPVAVEMKR